MTMVLTLSQLQNWDTDHLINAATYWTNTANRWQDTFTQVNNQSHALEWEGQGGDALRTRTGGDLATVSAKADTLRSVAQVARTSAGNIAAAKRQALYAVEDAQNAEFTVEEDLSVTDRYYYTDPVERAARQAEADELAAVIYQRATALLNAETQASAHLSSAAGALNVPAAGPDEFDLDTQYIRPAGLTAPAPASGYECVAGVTAVTMTVVQVTQTKTWWTQPGGSNGKHCK
ncbi:hypothetical protein [Mycobacterium lentiflavum]